MQTKREKIRSVALIYVSVSLGLIVCFLVQKLSGIAVPRGVRGVANLTVGGLGALLVFPRLLKLPFGSVPLGEYCRRLGLYPFPPGAWKHVLLGLLLAACTVGGMLAGTLLTGKYQVDWRTVNVSQFVFSIGPGLWEETLFRGVLMMLLLQWTRSLPRAVIFQVLLFGLGHLGGIDPWDLVDVGSVMLLALAFTYTAHRTRSLLAGMVFHFLHDALVYLPQLPGGKYTGFHDNMVFYLGLWGFLGVGCLLVWLASGPLGVRAEQPLYDLSRAGAASE
jgi:membrane protease YdiL (CAAX protease family)